MIKNIVIKEGLIEDAVEISATITEFDRAYEKKYFEDRYKDKKKLILIAYIDNQAVGYMIFYNRYDEHSFCCWMTGVNPKYRRLGVLKELMDYGFDWAKKNGYKKIRIKTRNNRREMLSYLVKYGFLFINVVPYIETIDNRIELEKST